MTSNKHPLDQIEPAALVDSTLLFPIEDSKVDAYRLQLSIAVSLKRIADTLDGTAAGVCVTETIFGRKA